MVAAPVIDAAERIYVGSSDGTFYALDAVAGRELWRVATGAPVTAAAALGSDGAIYAAAGSRLSALSVDGAWRWTFDARTGRDRHRVTLGVRDTWQGGPAIASDGNVCAGNDDFFEYCLDARGRVVWAVRTGLPVWGQIAFGRDGTGYVASLDMNVYALETGTGAVRWRRNLGAPLATAVAVGDDETLYVVGLDGRMHALEAASGTPRWSVQAGEPVLSAPAIAADGTIYVASTDGRLSAFEGNSGARRWTQRFAAPLRSPPAIGPDPESGAGYLVYLGGGDGRLSAVEPNGGLRWVYDAEATPRVASAPQLDGGPALGRHGVAVGAAAGAVHYVPYDYYRREAPAGIRRPSLSASTPMAQWQVIRPTGVIDERSLATAEPDARAIRVGRTQVLTLRGAHPPSAEGREPELLADGIDSRGTQGKYRMVPLGDRRSVAMVPRSILPGGLSMPVSVSGRFATGTEPAAVVEGHAVLDAEDASVENPIALRLHAGFRFAHFTVSQPPALAALVGPALHGVTLPFVIVETLPERRTFAAWGIQTIGPNDAARPARRDLLYALRGEWSGDAVVIETTSVFADIAGVTVPVDRVLFAGRFVPGGRMAPGATLFAEVRPPGLWTSLDALVVDGGGEAAPRTWLQDMVRRGGVIDLLRAAIETVPPFARIVAHRAWEPLGIVNSEGEIVAVGTFDLTPMTAGELSPPPVRVRSVAADPQARRVLAEIVPEGSGTADTVVAILLVDSATGAPLPIDYNRLLTRARFADGTLQVELRIPDTTPLPPGGTRAHVMAGLASVATATF